MIERGQGNLDGALVALKSAESLLGKMDDFFYPVQIHRELSQVYAEQADWASAYAYLDRYQKLYQQALGSAARARFYTLQIQAELDEAERERDFARLKQAEAERARSELEALNRELAAKVEEIERLQVQLREQAVRDPLTELYNRRYLQDELANEIKTAERRGGSFCVVLIDLDHFKRVNDEYGHPMGDKVLVELARLMRASIRGSDFACRFGGEEFCLVLVDISAEQAVARINDLRERLGRMVLRRGGQRLDHLTFSAGVAEYPTHGKTVDKLLQAADRALYRAKGSGRNCVLLAGREVARV
jgi:diguanylate cyclase (GGDEF)-like protein